jgi:hypothetical protein
MIPMISAAVSPPVAPCTGLPSASVGGAAVNALSMAPCCASSAAIFILASLSACIR